MHRPVLAVPGPVTSETSRGTHRLIVEGLAGLAADLEDLRSAVDPITVHPRIGDRADSISRAMREVLDVLPSDGNEGVRASEMRGLSEAEIVVRSGRDLADVQAQLAAASTLGVVRRESDGRWSYLPHAERELVASGRA